MLGLGNYDMILGMDWLEKFSPMWIDWKRKRMRFQHRGNNVTLTGVKDQTDHCRLILGSQLAGMANRGGHISDDSSLYNQGGA